MCRANESLAEWLPSMEQALESGAAHSAAVPFTPPELLAAVAVPHHALVDHVGDDKGQIGARRPRQHPAQLVRR
jgi:hypothetical protein